MTNFRTAGFQQLPVVVKNIIIINVLMVLLQFALGRMGINLGDYMGMHYWASPLFRWWQPLTHMFMHGDPGDVEGTFFHIAFNMFALWMFGGILENLWGPKRFLVFYLICGIGAALCHIGVLTLEYKNLGVDLAHFNQNPTFVEYAQFVRHHNFSGDPTFEKILKFWSDNPECSNCAKLASEMFYAKLNEGMVGASGAVFGILFAFGYLFPNAELMFLFVPIPVKAKWAVAIYAGIELFSGLRNSPGDNIAHFAHLGGMLFAFILLRIWGKHIRDSFY